MPSGMGNSIGCEYPSARTTFLPLTSARYPTPTISRSFLNPVVTPVTALATKARASPCKAFCSSESRSAWSVPSFCSKRIPRGIFTLILPLGPWTSTVAAEICTFTPLGTGMIFFPMRDIFSSLASPLPDFAEYFAADVGLSRGAARHHAPRRRHDADAQATDDAAQFLRARVLAAAGLRHALQVRDGAAPVGRILQEHAKDLVALRFLHELVRLDKSLFLHDAHHFGLQLRRRHVHPRVLGFRGVPDARQQIGNRIGHHREFVLLPARLEHAGNFTAERQSAKTDTAHFKLPQEAARPAANAAAVAHANLELRLLLHLRELRISRHSSPQPRSGTPSPRNNSRPSSSFLALVVKVMFIPLILSTRV